MALREIATKYYLEQGYNCAEALLLAGNELYSLGIGEKDLLIISGFGGGMGCGSTCGAVAGCIALLGRLQLEKAAHESETFGPNCAAFIAAVKEEYGSCDCSDLRPKLAGDKPRCVGTVEAIAEVFEAHLSKSGIVK